MARIDRFVEALFEKGADGLVFLPGEKVALRASGGSRPITASALHAKVIENLLREIVPAELASELSQDGEHAFPYAAPSGTVSLRVVRRREVARLEVVPAASDAGAASAPASAAAEAQPARAPVEEPARPAVQDTPPAAAARPAAPANGSTGEPVAAMEELLREMVREGCSDLHVTAGSPPLLRKDGALVPSPCAPLSSDRTREILFSIAPPERRAEFEELSDTDFSYEIEGVARFRCNLFVDRTGVGGVFRVIPSAIPTAEDLGLPPAVLELCGLGKGLVVVTGPTGSGKSTTLAAMVDYINRERASHIITIEDPIEFVHPNKRCLINQREIGSHTRGFKSALRAALREDPDIVLVGELRDLETVEIAIETAETGHLVFATLHTNTAASTVDRIIDQFPTDRQGQIRTMLSNSLKGVIAQTLCRKIGGGRVAALEILIVNAAVSNLIREAKTFQIPSVMQAGKKLGMQTLNDALVQRVANGEVEPQDACEKAVARDELRKLLSGRGIQLPGEPESL